MPRFELLLAENFVPLVANIGLISLAAWGVSFLHLRTSLASDLEYRLNRPLVGVVFGVTSGMLMFLPVEMEPGIFADGRGAPLLLAGVVGGPVGAAITGMMAGAVRFLLGGAGMPTGVAYIVLITLCGCAWGWWANRRGRNPLCLWSLAGISVLATAGSAPAFLLMPDGKFVPSLLQLWPVLLIANLVGVVILGKLLDRDRHRFQIEQELYQKRIAAELSGAAKARFLSTVGHEVKTPLNAIIGFSDIIRHDGLGHGINAEYRQFAENIQRSGQKLLSLIDGALDLSSLDEGRRTLGIVPTPVDKIWPHPIARFRSAAAFKGVSLSLEPSSDCSEILVDFKAAQQVVYGLIGNAVKFTEPGGSVTCRSVREGNSVRLIVKDTGCGMPEEEIPRLMQAFEQGDGLLSERRSGTGIGLTLAGMLVAKMNGHLEIRSRVGEGTEVSVAFSIADPGKELVDGARPPVRVHESA